MVLKSVDNAYDDTAIVDDQKNVRHPHARCSCTVDMRWGKLWSVVVGRMLGVHVCTVLLRKILPLVPARV